VAATNIVHVVVPDAIDDPLRPSGGNRYDRNVCDRLAGSGWRVHEHAIPDAWPQLGRTGGEALARVVSQIPDGAVMLVDGLMAGPSAPVLVPAARRVSLVVLVHMPPGGLGTVPGQADVLAAARAVIATSGWVRDALLRAYPLRSDAVQVAEPGVDPGTLAKGTPSGAELLCVAAVASHKGHDVLLTALADLAHQRWHCRCVGPLDGDPRFVSGVCRQARVAGVDDRVEFTGPRTGPDLEAAFGSADVLVHPARVEGYGMVVSEALAHGLPVITTTAGGLPDALGATPDGVRPGLLVPAGDAPALAGAISTWLTDGDLRERLRCAAFARRRGLPTWSTTTERIEHVLRALA
jgi:glycosyltransferase involved in cell wall biosynthesis